MNTSNVAYSVVRVREGSFDRQITKVLKVLIPTISKARSADRPLYNPDLDEYMSPADTVLFMTLTYNRPIPTAKKHDWRRRRCSCRSLNWHR
ncbi:hypothetical protein [Aureimonas altamirensis]|uniref:hypothetical protein n=1 Tax=Aureimonas altamirensis TaxID=370622 RepID=UPI00255552F0|nr:hypothetical protein [Aureimonas altamirensis]